MIKQKSFIFNFNNDKNELNFFVNKTNSYAFNALVNNNFNFSFLYGPKKSGKSSLAQIWLKKNNAIKYNNELSSRVRGKKKLVNKDIYDITIAPLMIILE